MNPPIDEAGILRSKIAALEELLEVHERTALDVTLRLETDRTRLHELFESVPASIAILSGPDLTFTFANAEYRSLVGDAAVVGTPIREAFPDPALEPYFSLLHDVLQTGQPHIAMESAVTLPADPTVVRYFNYSYIPMRNDGGEIVAVLVHAVDVSEMTHARQAIESLVDDLREVADLAVEMNAQLSIADVARIAVDGTARILGAQATLRVKRDARFAEDTTASAGHASSGMDVAEELAGNGSRSLGTLTITRDAPLSPAERAVLTQVARLTAVAIGRAETYEREHQIAEVLQRSLLPAALPVVPGIRVATRYRPGGLGEEVGGDWYDVIALPDGRVAFVLGDVGGKGVRAASVMGQIRTAVRAYALGGNAPADVFSKTDRLLQGMDPDHMVTAVYLALDTASGEATYVTAGHPPPLVIQPGERPTFVRSSPSLPLGVMAHAPFHEERLMLRDGGVLMFYTDGLIERRGEGLQTGLDRLAAAAASAPAELEELCDHVLASMLPAHLTDDVAVLAFRAELLAAKPLDLAFAATPQEAPAVRHVIERWMRAVGVGEQEAFDIIVACGEACANAIEHAYDPGRGSVRISAALVDDTMTITVSDGGRWRPQEERRYRGRGFPLMHAMMDQVEIKRSPEGTEIRMRRRLRGAGT